MNFNIIILNEHLAIQFGLNDPLRQNDSDPLQSKATLAEKWLQLNNPQAINPSHAAASNASIQPDVQFATLKQIANVVVFERYNKTNFHMLNTLMKMAVH